MEIVWPFGSLTVLTTPCSSRSRFSMAPAGSAAEKLGGRRGVTDGFDEREKNNGEARLSKGRGWASVCGGTMWPRSMQPGGRRRGLLAGRQKALSLLLVPTDRFLCGGVGGLGQAKPGPVSGGVQACAGLAGGGAEGKESWSGTVLLEETPPDDCSRTTVAAVRP